MLHANGSATTLAPHMKKIFSSKYYTADQAWPRQDSWWFEIPISHLRDNRIAHIHLLCQQSPEAMEFLYLKIPTDFFLSHINQLTVQKSGNISIFPSAESDTFLRDVRGKARVDFSAFLVV